MTSDLPTHDDPWLYEQAHTSQCDEGPNHPGAACHASTSTGATMSDLYWAWPSNSRKAHCFENGHSLCGRWMFFGSQPDQPQHLGDEPGRDDCKACWRAAKKRSDDDQ
jgi:hypothetical protein